MTYFLNTLSDTRFTNDVLENGDTLVHLCVKNDSKESDWKTFMVKLISMDSSLLDRRNGSGESPLTLSVIAGKKDIAKYLLEKGVAVTNVQFITSCENSETMGREWLEIVSLIVSRDSQIKDNIVNGLHPVMHCAINQWKECTRFLLNLGVDVSVVDHYHRTLLHYCVRNYVQGEDDVWKDVFRLVSCKCAELVDARDDRGVSARERLMAFDLESWLVSE